jgi:hypothetical protein
MTLKCPHCGQAHKCGHCDLGRCDFHKPKEEKSQDWRGSKYYPAIEPTAEPTCNFCHKEFAFWKDLYSHLQTHIDDETGGKDVSYQITERDKELLEELFEKFSKQLPTPHPFRTITPFQGRCEDCSLPKGNLVHQQQEDLSKDPKESITSSVPGIGVEYVGNQRQTKLTLERAKPVFHHHFTPYSGFRKFLALLTCIRCKKALCGYCVVKGVTLGPLCKKCTHMKGRLARIWSH